MTKGVKKNNFEILNKTKTNPSIDGLVFANMKNEVLGKDYELSLVIVGKEEIRKLNKSYRKINEATDILSFSLGKKDGEIFLCPEIARGEAPRFGRSYENFLNYLFIHGLTHLKGFEHSSRMDVKEERIRKKFGV